MTPTSRILLYAHDGCGLGHLRRQLTIAAAIRRRSPTTAVLVATGVDELGPFTIPSTVGVLKVPGLVKIANHDYSPRHLTLPRTETTELRAGLLASAVEHFDPDVLLADKHPVGPSGELIPALERLRERGGQAILGVRDVLDDPTAFAAQWSGAGLDEAFENHYGGALVYGMPSLLDPLEGAGIPAAVLERATWCGYVVEPSGRAATTPIIVGDARPLVVACAGGGDDGSRLLRTFIEASRDASWRAVVVTGPLASDEERVGVEHAAADAGIEVHRKVDDLSRWFPSVDALVCMGGYNTMLEAAATATPVVCVPRIRPRQEQLIRARAFGARGLVHVVEPADLTPEAVGDGVRAALSVTRADLAGRIARHLDLGGADRAADVLVQVARSRTAAVTA